MAARPFWAGHIEYVPFYTGDELPCLYTGMTRLPNENARMFYLLAQKITPGDDDPVIFYLSGGPGHSGLKDFFFEVGPLIMSKPDDFVITDAVASWTEVANVVFVDNPVNTGFSYADYLVKNSTRTGQDFIHFMVEFFKMYPQL